MDNVFLAICLLAFLFLILGLVHPKLAFVKRRRWVVVIYPIIMLFSFIGVGVTGDDPAPASADVQPKKIETNDKAETKKDQKPKKDNVKKDDEEKGKKEKKKKEPLEQLKEKKYIKSVELDDDHTLNVEIDASNALTVNFIFDKAVDILEDMQIAFKDDRVTGYYAMVYMDMVDNKGNEMEEEGFNMYYSREDFEELNYKKFSEMSYSEPWRIFNESTSYLIHPVLFNEIKDKYRNNLIKGSNKPLLVE